jgi:hypothetical protein
MLEYILVAAVLAVAASAITGRKPAVASRQRYEPGSAGASIGQRAAHRAPTPSPGCGMVACRREGGIATTAHHGARAATHVRDWEAAGP